MSEKNMTDLVRECRAAAVAASEAHGRMKAAESALTEAGRVWKDAEDAARDAQRRLLAAVYAKEVGGE